jgi:hypothetical protein
MQKPPLHVAFPESQVETRFITSSKLSVFVNGRGPQESPRRNIYWLVVAVVVVVDAAVVVAVAVC